MSISDADGEWTVNQLREAIASVRDGDSEGAQQAMDRLLAEAEDPDSVRDHIQQQLDN